MTDTIRKAFEAWAKCASLDVDSKAKNGWGQDKYLPHIESMWVGWQAALAAPQPSPDQQLCRFYDVTTFPDLVEAQSRHIEKLQAKLPISTEDLAVKKVREG